MLRLSTYFISCILLLWYRWINKTSGEYLLYYSDSYLYSLSTLLFPLSHIEDVMLSKDNRIHLVGTLNSLYPPPICIPTLLPCLACIFSCHSRRVSFCMFWILFVHRFFRDLRFSPLSAFTPPSYVSSTSFYVQTFVVYFKNINN